MLGEVGNEADPPALQNARSCCVARIEAIHGLRKDYFLVRIFKVLDLYAIEGGDRDGGDHG